MNATSYTVTRNNDGSVTHYYDDGRVERLTQADMRTQVASLRADLNKVLGNVDAALEAFSG